MTIFVNMLNRLYLILILGLFLFIPSLSLAKEIYPARAYLNSETISSGYTLKLSNKRFQLGLPSQSLTHPAKVIIDREDETNLPLEGSISPVYTFNIKSEIQGPIWLKIKTKKIDFYNQDVYLKYWDSSVGGWITIPSARQGRIVKGAIHLPYAQVAVFAQEKNYDIGTATWYNWYGAASNKYPFGTKLEVTNLDNGQSCLVEVVSTGPFNHHIIDLPKTAFAAIADLSTGVINVKVQEYLP